MPTITINPVNIQANKLAATASRNLTANINAITVQMLDGSGNTTPLSNSDWLTTVGNVICWGLQISTDGGTTWNWWFYQGDPTGQNTSIFLPFGSLDRNGNMPALAVSSSDLVGQSGNQLRLAALVDTNIRLGAVVTF